MVFAFLSVGLFNSSFAFILNSLWILQQYICNSFLFWVLYHFWSGLLRNLDDIHNSSQSGLLGYVCFAFIWFTSSVVGLSAISHQLGLLIWSERGELGKMPLFLSSSHFIIHYRLVFLKCHLIIPVTFVRCD